MQAKRDAIRAAHAAKRERQMSVISLKFESDKPLKRTVFDGVRNLEISSGEEATVLFIKNSMGNWC